MGWQETLRNTNNIILTITLMLCMVLVMMMGRQEALRNTNTIILTITFMLCMVVVMMMGMIF